MFQTGTLMKAQITLPATTGTPRVQWLKMLGQGGWIALDALASWVWSLAGARAAELFPHDEE
jgi:hypothetical protein